MNIIVLDGYTLNPGDLNWNSLEALGNIKIYDRTPDSLILERAKDADIILTNKVVLDSLILSKLPTLKYIGVLATGYNVVDIEFAKSRGIVVTNIPAYSTNSVAQLTFSLILELAQNVGIHSTAVLNGEWSSSKDFCFLKKTMIELNGRTLGIIGFGNIGKAVANIAQAFGLKVLVKSGHKITDNNFIKNVSLDTLFKESDFVSLHCPLTNETENIINKENLQLMKTSAFVINTGRGALINEIELAEALKNKTIAGAALDVLSKEPAEASNPLIPIENCIITPHIAWATLASRTRLMNIAVKNIKGFINGKVMNVI